MISVLPALSLVFRPLNICFTRARRKCQPLVVRSLPRAARL